MRLAALLVLLGLLLLGTAAPHVHAEDEMDAPAASQSLLLGPATVLASPGCPRAIDSFLPGGKRPARLVWPLPKGPLLLLGLPHEDDVAQQIADAFQIDTDDLDGGYRIAAWRSATRPICVIMAADAAALAAARFELDTSAPMEMVAPDMRSLDFKRPNQEAGVAVQKGTRLVTPRYALRAWAPYLRDDRATITAADVTRAAGAHVNRLWFRPRDLRSKDAGKLLALARSHGIVPVLYAPLFDATVDNDQPMRPFLPPYVEGLWKLAKLRHDIRHFAFELDIDTRTRKRHPRTRAECEQHAINYVGLSFFPRAEEMLIIPGAHADDLAPDAQSLPTIARAISGKDGPRVAPVAAERIQVGWSGPQAYAEAITVAQAEARAKTAGTPLILIDRWAEPFQDEATPYVPSLPRGRADGLRDVFDGVVVLGRRGTDATLESLWEPVEGAHFGAGLLADLVPGQPNQLTGPAWLDEVSKRLGAAEAEYHGLVPWLAPLRAEFERGRARAKEGHVLYADSLAEIHATIDGRMDDEIWGLMGAPKFAPIAAPDGTSVNLFASDAGLTFGVRVPAAVMQARALLLQITLRRPGAERGITAELTKEGWRIRGALGGGRPADAQSRHAHVSSPDAFTAELQLDRFVLGGDAHGGRVFELGIHWGPLPLWPKSKSIGARGVLFVRP